MNENNLENSKKIKDDQEMLDIIVKIIKIQHQIDHPDHYGMIEALHEAQQIAHDDIVQSVYQQGGVVYKKSWDEISDAELYNLLPQYKQGLINHGISKIGQGEFEKAFKQLKNM